MFKKIFILQIKEYQNIQSKYKPDESNFLIIHWVEIFIILIIAISIYVLAREEVNFVYKDLPGAGQFGDFVGGYIGTVFTLVSVLILYMTLRLQRISTEIEKFENKYFGLLNLHRDNVREIGIGNVNGKKVFVLMIREFREIHKIVLKVVGELSLIHDKEEILRVSYLIFFYGLGPNSTRIMRRTLKGYSDCTINRIVTELYKVRKKVKRKRNFTFKPFGGHQSRLGHYYRHLFQSIQYVDIQKLSINKYEYVKTIRAQLTNHEQALLFLNSITFLGRVWWEEEFMIRYKMVQNIPDNFFHPENEIDLKEYFKPDYFEWQKLIKNNDK